MKELILQIILKKLAKAIIGKYQPLIIGITGSVGKTSTKEAIYCVLSRVFLKEKVRASIKNYNNELGVPLTIVGEESGGRSIVGWLKVFWRSLALLFSRSDYPKFLILEMGADKPGDIKYLTSFVEPKIGIITAIGEIPVHVEFYKNSLQVAKEKANLIRALPISGWAILNYDDEAASRMAEQVKTGKILTYGFNEGADVRAINFEAAGISQNSYATFKIDYRGKIVPARIKGILGRHQLYAVLAAICAGIALDINLIEIIESLADYQAPAGRMKLIEGIKHAWLIDDTYNASPAAMAGALEVLKNIKMAGDGSRCVAVLGDMMELGQFTERAHRIVGKKAAEFADILFAVGLRAKFIAAEAAESGMARENILEFDTADEAATAVQGTIKEGDVVLIKGSQSMRMEKIVEEIMADPRQAKNLLVRQSDDWKSL